MKRIAIFGSTGSIGKSTLSVADHLGSDIQVLALVCRQDTVTLKQQIERYHPRYVAVHDEKKAQEIQSSYPQLTVFSGPQGVIELAQVEEIDLVVMAIVGLEALLPTLNAIESKKSIALANKEVLVSAGELVMEKARACGVTIIPVDSEHSALFQLLENRSVDEISRLILTASGGPFHKHTMEQLKSVSLEEALKHPTWTMGSKVTIDSSTLMNKGFEVIEAKWLFDFPASKIDVVIHPQSVVHSFVELVDSTLLAHIHEPDMVHPIQYALTYPKRTASLLAPFDFTKQRSLDFYPPDTKRFSCLDLAFHSMKEGGSLPCYLNAANEVLVERLLNKEMSWWEMTQKLSQLMEKHKKETLTSVDAVLSIDSEGRREAKEI